jgi:hypothetical protein
LRGNNGTAQQVEHFIAVKVTEDFVRALIAEAVSTIRIDVIHHQRAILLRTPAEVLSLGNETANEFMISFTGPLLVRRRRITVKEMSPTYAVRPEFNC